MAKSGFFVIIHTNLMCEYVKLPYSNKLLQNFA